MAMSEQQAASRRRAADHSPPAGTQDGVRARAEKIRESLDALIDEIDDVLEENAEEFVNSYVQRGGE